MFEAAILRNDVIPVEDVQPRLNNDRSVKEGNLIIEQEYIFQQLHSADCEQGYRCRDKVIVGPECNSIDCASNIPGVD